MNRISLHHIKLSPLLLWICPPILILWFSVGYVFGLLKTPTWNATSNNIVLGSTDILQATSSAALTWTSGGLVTLWFDDAWDTQYTVAFPLLREKRVNAAVAVPTRAVGTVNYMSWDQVKRVMSEGWEITAHSRTHHCEPDTMTAQDITNETLGSKQDLAAVGIFTDHYVTPCGASDLRVTTEVKKYFLTLRSSEQGFNSLPYPDWYNVKVQHITPEVTIEKLISWITEAKQTSSWLILMFHQIDDSHSPYSTTKTFFTDAINTIVGAEIPVVIPSQVYQMSTNYR